MNTYRVMLSVQTPSGTPWQSDTIFGHLCWHYAWREGQAALEAWTDRFRSGDPPFLLSDGFPGELLPRPHGLPKLKMPDRKAEGLEVARKQKDLKKIAWLLPQEFTDIRQGKAVDLDLNADREAFTTHVDFHNQINRLSNTTGDEGQLYPFEGIACPQVTIYLRIAEGEEQHVRTAFEDVARSGYGKRASTGHGRIAACKWEACAFQPVTEPNAFVSLSHFVPAQGDPTDGQWRSMVKYGKLGGDRAGATNPFKLPLLMLTPGSWFRAEDAPKDWYGRLVEGVSPEFPDVVQYGFAFALPMQV